MTAVDAEAVVARLRELDARSGGDREAWSAPWVAERERLHALAREVVPGVEIERDAFGNHGYLLRGARAETVLIGSHLDAVPGGGWLDGCLGVHAGLAVLAAIASDGEPPLSVAVVDWADEEGSRFGRSLLGSSAATGALTRDEVERLRDRTDDGGGAAVVLAEHDVDLGRLGTTSSRLDDVVCALELHVEQGPVLERGGHACGAVSGCLGVRRARFVVEGAAGHAGATPMDVRRDPVRAAAAIVSGLGDAAEAAGALATVGVIAAEPAIPTAVAARCTFTLDLRHAELEPLEALESDVLALAERTAADRGCTVRHEPLWTIDPVAFDPGLVALADAACDGPRVVSGPLHDSAALAQHGIPTAMLFVASIGGVSHDRAEDSREADLAAGVRALHATTLAAMAAAG